MKGENLKLLKQTTQLFTRLRARGCSYNLIVKTTWRLNLLNVSRLYYKTINCKKLNTAFCSVTTYHFTVASPKEHLYEQMASNPSFTETNIQKANPYLSLISYIRGTQRLFSVKYLFGEANVT